MCLWYRTLSGYERIWDFGRSSSAPRKWAVPAFRCQFNFATWKYSQRGLLISQNTLLTVDRFKYFQHLLMRSADTVHSYYITEKMCHSLDVKISFKRFWDFGPGCLAAWLQNNLRKWNWNYLQNIPFRSPFKYLFLRVTHWGVFSSALAPQLHNRNKMKLCVLPRSAVT